MAFFLLKLFHNQSRQLAQLQMANNALKDHALEAQSDVTDAATKAASSIAQESSPICWPLWGAVS